MAILLDTNVLLYAFDPFDGRKRARALEIWSAPPEMPVISTQVLQEFYAAATSKRLLERDVARNVVGELSEWTVVQITPLHIQEAIHTTFSYSISLWDALIVEAARSFGCNSVWTEDLQHGQTIRGVRIVNPFL